MSTVEHIGEERVDYRAALEGAVYRRLTNAGYLLISGETRFDYLQRQTSNDLRALSAERAVPNALTAPTGRILEIFTCLQVPEGIALLAPEGRGAGLAAYFQKRIFFNDQVTVEDLSEDWAQFELHGPHTANSLAALGLAQAPELNEVEHFEWQGKAGLALGLRGLSAELGTRLVLPSGSADAASAGLVESGAIELSGESAELLRVERGLAGAPELNGDYTPFEVGMADLVSAEKGCYTGQEVLARQVTYDKITKQLALLACEQLAEPGAAVLADGKRAGVVSSVALSPRRGPLALAVLRRPHHEVDTALSLEQPEGNEGRVIEPLSAHF